MRSIMSLRPKMREKNQAIEILSYIYEMKMLIDAMEGYVFI